MFSKQSLAERLEAFANEVNEVDFVKSKLQVEKVGHSNSGEVILAQLFHYIERTMAKVMDVFEQIDADSSGALDKVEFRRAVAMMGFEVPGAVVDTLRKPEQFEVDAAFDALDVDGGGEVEIEEFLAAMRAQRKQAALDALERQQRGDTYIDDHNSVRKAHELSVEQIKEIGRTIVLCSGNGGMWRPSEKVVKSLEKWLWNVELFAFMDAEERRRFCINCDVYCAQTDSPVLRKGDASGGLFVLFQGSCAIYLPRSQSVSRIDAKAGLRLDVAKSTTTSSKFTKVVQDTTRLNELVQDATQRKGDGITQREADGDEMRSDNVFSSAVRSTARRWLHRHKMDKVVGSTGTPGHPPRGWMHRRKAVDLSCESTGPRSTAELVELTFGPGEVFGEERAFHNINSDLVRAQGLYSVSATVVALEPCQFIVIKQPDSLVLLEQAYQRLQEYKIAFLKRIPHYKYCSQESLKLLARNLRRVVCAPRQVLAEEGQLADNAFFIVSGKMQVEQGGKPVAVLGPETCFGDWGVINGETRAASLSCVTECEVLVVHSYNFIRAVDMRIIAALKEKQRLVQSGKSFASATQIVDDQVGQSNPFAPACCIMLALLFILLTDLSAGAKSYCIDDV